MPLISSKGMYGLSAMHELAKNKSSAPMQIREISANADIPQNYLEQLLSKLRRAQLVVSVRGSKGGYLLAREAKDIKILDILMVLENDLKICDSKSTNAVLNLFFAEIKDKMKEIFDLNLDELDKYQAKLNQFINYSI